MPKNKNRHYFIPFILYCITIMKYCSVFGFVETFGTDKPIKKIDYHKYQIIDKVPEKSANITAQIDHSLRLQQCYNDTDILQSLNKSGYNKHKIPSIKGAVNVTVEVWVQEISTISALTSDFKLDIYISEMWLDPGLNFDKFPMRPCKNNITLTHDALTKIWTPNTCFINSKTAGIHDSPFRNVWLLLFANGTIWTNYRMALSGPCSMNLQAFPMDFVNCSLTFESFNYNTDEVHMAWLEHNPVSLLGDIKQRWTQSYRASTEPNSREPLMQLADFILINISNYALVFPYPAGKWDELTMSFLFQRRAGWYILQAYLPTYLTIFISWISFYLGSGIAARTLLGVNALLALTFQFGNIISNLPRVSYVKAIDVWMLSCMTFVFCSLLELAFVGYLVTKDPRYNHSQKTLLKKRSVYEPIGGRNGAESKSRLVLVVSNSGWTHERVDFISAIGFPVFFIVFNACYWWYYGWYINSDQYR